MIIPKEQALINLLHDKCVGLLGHSGYSEQELEDVDAIIAINASFFNCTSVKPNVLVLGEWLFDPKHIMTGHRIKFDKLYCEHIVLLTHIDQYEHKLDVMHDVYDMQCNTLTVLSPDQQKFLVTGNLDADVKQVPLFYNALTALMLANHYGANRIKPLGFPIMVSTEARVI